MKLKNFLIDPDPPEEEQKSDEDALNQISIADTANITGLTTGA